MSSFTICPPLVAIPPDYKLFEVQLGFEYRVGNEYSDEVIKIHKGFITDGASIPKFFWSIIGGPLGPYAPAAVVHDRCYKTPPFFHHRYTRKKSDYVFYEALGVLEVPWWKRKVMYAGVRIGGWRAWNRYRKKDKPT